MQVAPTAPRVTFWCSRHPAHHSSWLPIAFGSQALAHCTAQRPCVWLACGPRLPAHLFGLRQPLCSISHGSHSEQGGGGSYSQGLLFLWTGRNFRLPRGKNIEEKAPPSALLGLGVGYLLTWEKRTALSARYLSLPVLQKDACGPVSSGCDWGGLCFGKGEVYGFGREEINLWGRTLRKPTPSRVLFIIALKLWRNRALSDPRASASALSSLQGPSHCSEFPSCVQTHSGSARAAAVTTTPFSRPTPGLLPRVSTKLC